MASLYLRATQKKMHPRKVVQVTVLIALIFAGCSKPASVQVATPSPTATSRLVQETTPSPAAVSGLVIITPYYSKIESTTDPGEWCNENKLGITLSKEVQKLYYLNDPFLAIEKLDTFLVEIYLLGDDPETEKREARYCGISVVSNDQMQEGIKYGYTQDEVNTCKVESMKPLVDLNNPKFWKLPDNTIRRHRANEADGKCYWAVEAITPEIRERLNSASQLNPDSWYGILY